MNKACRERNRLVSLQACNLLHFLLDKFAASRNKYAPVIYKSLTFITVDVFQNAEVRYEILNNFISLFRNHPSIPINILCEPVFKQVEISIEKESVMQGNQSILQP